MTGPERHPGWCAQRHAAWMVHEAVIGAPLELSASLAMSVRLVQVEGDVVEVNLIRHEPLQTTVTRLSIVEASIYRDALSEALALVAR